MSQAGHILLIDDDRGTRETLSDVLLLKGYAVETAGLGQEGLKKLRAHPFDAAIVDVKLPDIFGLDLLRLIKEASPETEVILITAFASLNSAIQAVSGDSFAYLTKPFKMDHLLVTLENALEKRRLAIENRRLYQATMQELAERTRAEEELRESETTFRSLVESANDAIILSDGSGNIVSWNRAAQTIFGYGEKEVLGKPLTVLMPERYRDSHRKGLDRLRSTGLAHVLGKTIELHGLKKGGSEFPLEISLTTWKKGRRTFYSGIIRDITKRKRAEEQLKQANAELARGEKALQETLLDLKESHQQLKAAQLQLIQSEKLESVGTLAAGVAHEVKNPLTIILQGIHYLSKHLPTNGDNVAMAIQDMDNAVKRANSIVKGLLDFSAASESSLTAEELNSVVEQSLSLVKHELDKCHVNAVRELSENLPPVRLDRNKIEQVFVNIFMNAIHAMPEGGTITVKTYAKRLTEISHNVGSRKADDFCIGQTVVMAEVEDTGTGIPKDKLAQVFDPFFTTKSTDKGKGLGLTVTRKIIDLHGGTIDIGNRKEGGVRVTIIFKAQGGNDHEQETDPAN